MYAWMRIGNTIAGHARLASRFGMLGVATRAVRTRHWQVSMINPRALKEVGIHA